MQTRSQQQICKFHHLPNNYIEKRI